MAASILTSTRIARGLTPQAVADLTKLSPRVIAAIENGSFHELPGGLYARAYIRTYARAVGLDDPKLTQAMIDAIPQEIVELEAIVKCRRAIGPQRRFDRRAVVVDAAVVATLGAGGVLICAGLTGAHGWSYASLAAAFLALAVPTQVLYFGLLGATGVGTVGARWFRVDFVAPAKGPVDGTELLRRTHAYFRSEAAALITGIALEIRAPEPCPRSGAAVR